MQLDITAGSMSGKAAAAVYNTLLSGVAFVIDYFRFIVVNTGEPDRQCRSSRGPCLKAYKFDKKKAWLLIQKLTLLKTRNTLKPTTF